MSSIAPISAISAAPPRIGQVWTTPFQCEPAWAGLASTNVSGIQIAAATARLRGSRAPQAAGSLWSRARARTGSRSRRPAGQPARERRQQRGDRRRDKKGKDGYPIYAKWADAYKKLTGVGLNYQSIGSGGGIKQIKAKTVTFGASDMPLKPDDLRRPACCSFR